MKNRMKYLILRPVTLVAITVELSLCGCTTVNTVEPAQSAAQREVLVDKRIVTDGRLYGRVRPVGVNTATVSGDFLKVQIEVQNLSSRLQPFAYRIEWFDSNGLVVNTPTSVWIDRQIQPGETLALTGIAPVEGAKDFRIKFISK